MSNKLMILTFVLLGVLYVFSLVRENVKVHIKWYAVDRLIILVIAGIVGVFFIKEYLESLKPKFEWPNLPDLPKIEDVFEKQESRGGGGRSGGAGAGRGF